MRKFNAFCRRHIVEPLYCRINDSPKLQYWQELEKTQFLPLERLREIQIRRLDEILRFVWDKNVFYRNRFNNVGLNPCDIRSSEDMRRLPVLTKSEIRNSTQTMVSRGFNIENLLHAKTGGSTGKALDIYLTEKCSELRNACALQRDRWAGWEVGEPIAACWGNPHQPDTFKEKLKGWLLNPVVYLDTMNVNEESVRVFFKEWRKVKPTLLFGHAHSLYLLSTYLRDMGVDIPRPKGIISTSMMLIPTERKVIEEVFGLRVTDRYGCEEVSLIGSECEKHDGMHLNIEHLFIEFIKDDGTAAAPGEPGKIIVTDLMNRAMPFIRYQVEDVGVPTDRKCPCGRGLPLLESVAGRVADFLVKKDGSKVAGVSLIENTLTLFPGLDQMQIIQNNYEEFQLNIVAGAPFNDEVSAKLKSYFEKVFGDTIIVDISIVEDILPEKSGKYRFSICKVD